VSSLLVGHTIISIHVAACQQGWHSQAWVFVRHLARIARIHKHKEKLKLPGLRLMSVVMAVLGCIREVDPLAIKARLAEPHVKTFI
jgi:hypothetical protein